jgi:hypothetical protein
MIQNDWRLLHLHDTPYARELNVMYLSNCNQLVL